MPPPYSSTLVPHARDSLELASLASSSQLGPDTDDTDSRQSISSSRKISLEHDDPQTPAAGGGAGFRHDRSFSISSGFDLAANLYPLSSTTGGGYAPIGAPASGVPQGGLGAGSPRKAQDPDVPQRPVADCRAHHRLGHLLRAEPGQLQCGIAGCGPHRLGHRWCSGLDRGQQLC